MLPTPTQTPAVTTAQGTLVDDPSGTPLSGVKVQIDPWITFATPGPTPTPIAATTTDTSGHFTVSERNGTYLLVIGDDDPTYPNNRPTIHDKIVLNGQTTLVAPNLQVIAPAPNYTPPAVETNGDYRLVTLDATREIPCIQDWDAQRTSRSLPKPVIDEWLTENARAAIATYVTGGSTSLTTADDTEGTTVTNQPCSDLVNVTFTNAASVYATINGPTWFGGAWLDDPTGGYGTLEFPGDVRVFTDSQNSVWP